VFFYGYAAFVMSAVIAVCSYDRSKATILINGCNFMRASLHQKASKPLKLERAWGA
jgi:hypothetical protein